MATVYAAFFGGRSGDRDCAGVFSGRAAAEACYSDEGSRDIEEFELDAPPPGVHGVNWHVSIALETGVIRDDYSVHDERPRDWCEVRSGRPYKDGPDSILVGSNVSREHAYRVAAEAWLAWLRDREQGIAPHDEVRCSRVAT